MILHDSLGQVTGIKFLNGKFNQTLDSEKFTFLIPEGMDVIDSRE